MQNKAFTIIELMIVIAVIAILIGVAIPRFEGMRDEANLSKAKSELRTIQTAIESFYINNSNVYPDTGVTLLETDLTTATPRIINEVFYDPFVAGGETEYNYFRSSNEAYYVVYSVGLDGADDITGIDDTGSLTGVQDDDIYASNGLGF